jgi:hypothetical protein
MLTVPLADVQQDALAFEAIHLFDDGAAKPRLEKAFGFRMSTIFSPVMLPYGTITMRAPTVSGERRSIKSNSLLVEKLAKGICSLNEVTNTPCRASSAGHCSKHFRHASAESIAIVNNP